VRSFIIVFIYSITLVVIGAYLGYRHNCSTCIPSKTLEGCEWVADSLAEQLRVCEFQAQNYLKEIILLKQK
jgi:hypothetical protein